MQYCGAPGCSVLVVRGYCPRHAALRSDLAGTRTWYYTDRWARLRRQVCLTQVWACAACGQVTLTLEVDHIRKHDGDPALFWDLANLQALCPPCHLSKTKTGA